MLPVSSWRVDRLATMKSVLAWLWALLGGASARQLLADSVLLAFAGGLLGVALAPSAMRTLIAFLPRDFAANALQSTVPVEAGTIP